MSALLRLIGWSLAVALVVLPVVAVLNGWVGSGHWPLTKLRATGAFERVDEAVLRETLLPYAQPGFFAVRLDQAQAAVARLPWVEQAEVRKRWPDVLEVRVTEHRPFARWGEDRLLSSQGRLFPAEGIEVPAGLPQLSGPDARVPDVVALYNEARSLLGPIGMEVQVVALDARGSWTLGLARAGAPGDRDEGVASDRMPPDSTTFDGRVATEVVVGRNEARARLERFARLMPRMLTQQAQRLVRADLRYTNGFALTWAPREVEAPGPGTGDPGPASSTPLATAPPALTPPVLNPRFYRVPDPRSPVPASKAST
ncbi:cell division protein FtsQ/DivIB [Lysobacter sp. D1-1-M9]|uniref:cell division protein FtsQ/DivIB n=1 Tax=Novilysobacter longmucuonensis TaxID=3098603 RepID=UPI002FC92764